MNHSINMTEAIVDKINVIKAILDKRMTQIAGGANLGLSPRQMRRLIKRYRTHGIQGIHRKRMPSNRAFSSEFKLRCVDLISKHYYDFGPSFASEKLEENHSIKVSKETVRHWMIEAELWRGKSRRKARIHQSRERRACFGELVQIDGSHHDWFEGRRGKCCLILMIDDATSQIVSARFEESETTLGYMRCTMEHLKRHGRPAAYYSDKHSIFKVNNKKSIDYRLEDTQFKRAVNDLGIELIYASSSQAKGRVERANQTLQDRLIKEMRLQGLVSIEEANKYLPRFIKQYNKKFGILPRDLNNGHRPVLQTIGELSYRLSCQEERIVSKNLEISYEGVIYQIQDVGKGHRLRQGRVQVCLMIDGSTKLYWQGKELTYKIFKKAGRYIEANDKTLSQVMDNIISGQISYPQGPQPLAA